MEIHRIIATFSGKVFVKVQFGGDAGSLPLWWVSENY